MLPRLFTIGGFTQHTYGVLVAAAFFLGLSIAARLARRDGLDAGRVFNLGVYMALFGLAGAKLLLVIAEWRTYAADPRRIFSLEALQAGGVFYGGFIAAAVFAGWYARRQGLPFLRTADAFAPGVAAGHAVGRLGCFAAGCCYGKVCSMPWGVTFSDAYASQMFGVPLGVPLHPTQLYEAAAETAIALLLLRLWKRRMFEGQVLAAYLGLYGVARFIIEFFRGDSDRGFLFGGALSTSQFIALFMMALGAALWLRHRRAPLVRAAPG